MKVRYLVDKKAKGDTAAEYHPVYTIDTNPLFIAEEKSAVLIPNYASANKVACFSGVMAEHSRAVFSYKDKSGLVSQVDLPAGYQIVYAKSAMPREIRRVEDPVQIHVTRKDWSKKAEHIAAHGTTGYFQRCVFGGSSPNIPPGYHIVAIQSIAAGIPVLMEENVALACITARNTQKNHFDRYAHGNSDPFPRLVLSRVRIPASQFAVQLPKAHGVAPGAPDVQAQTAVVSDILNPQRLFANNRSGAGLALRDITARENRGATSAATALAPVGGGFGGVFKKHEGVTEVADQTPKGCGLNHK